jgi:copper chaperone
MMSDVVLQVPEVHCDNCKTGLEGAVGALDGVSTVEVVVSDATISVTYDDSELELATIKHAIEEQGYAVFG